MRKKAPIKTVAEAKARVAGLVEENKAAEELLQKVCNDAERWQRLQAQARTQGIDEAQFTSLCGKMVRTRKEWTHLPSEAARHMAAFHGLLLALGSTPTAAEETALQALCAPASQ